MSEICIKQHGQFNGKEKRKVSKLIEECHDQKKKKIRLQMFYITPEKRKRRQQMFTRNIRSFSQFIALSKYLYFATNAYGG